VALYSVYIVECRDGTLYTGIAVDVAKRLSEHESGNRRGAKYLRSRAPLELRLSQVVGDRGAALRVEARIKRLSRTEKLDLIAGRRSLTSLAGERQVPVETSPA
jgi:putative endonuclease